MPMSIEGGTFGTWGANIGLLADRLNRNSMQAVLEDAAQPILNQMRAIAPVKSGALRAAINTGNASKKGGYGTTNIRITIGVHRKDWHEEDYYPAYVEYGHGGPRHADPHPFIRPAVDATGDEALDRLANNLKRMFDP